MSWIDKFQDGCTGISYIAGLIGHEIEVEGCCTDHDVEYVAGGSYLEKIKSDWKLSECLYSGSKSKLVGGLRAIGALLITTFVPYSYIVWRRK